MQEKVTNRTPHDKLRANPKSRRAAVDAKCWSCQGGDPGVWSRATVDAIRACDARLCYLHPVRPYADDRRHLPVLAGEAHGSRNPMEMLSDGVEEPSLARCVKAQCYSCVSETDRGLRKAAVREVRACTATGCALHAVRGYR